MISCKIKQKHFRHIWQHLHTDQRVFFVNITSRWMAGCCKQYDKSIRLCYEDRLVHTIMWFNKRRLVKSVATSNIRHTNICIQINSSNLILKYYRGGVTILVLKSSIVVLQILSYINIVVFDCTLYYKWPDINFLLITQYDRRSF